ncbi:MAG TPA: FecR domain-containing protein [Chitinophagaceae bacterium]|nr:FecR domain-containing protein [Chitinophagaceae bacterium]
MHELFKKYLENRCSPEELKLLLKEFDIESNEELLRGLIIQELENEQEISFFTGEELENSLTGTFNAIKAKLDSEKINILAPVVPLMKRNWFRLAAAAVFVLAVIGVYLLVNQHPVELPVANNQHQTNDILPGGNKAVLTLSDRSGINLENLSNGTIVTEGGTKISKLNDGQLVYNILEEKPTQVLYNTVTTPRGGQYQLSLSDGSKVWLNSASSIRFPVSFAGDTRRVEVSGEAYFEVAKNASLPFKVDVDGKNEVEVLGTHFNINSYADEGSIKTTLLEGSVKVTSLKTGESKLITPGQQAQLNTDGQIAIGKADLDKVMAWKNGYFNFDGADTKTVMQFVSRWYDVDVVYEGEIPQREFGGDTEKNLKLSQLLKILKKNDLQFRLEGKKLVVLQKK